MIAKRNQHIIFAPLADFFHFLTSPFYLKREGHVFLYPLRMNLSLPISLLRFLSVHSLSSVWKIYVQSRETRLSTSSHIQVFKAVSVINFNILIACRRNIYILLHMACVSMLINGLDKFFLQEPPVFVFLAIIIVSFVHSTWIRYGYTNSNLEFPLPNIIHYCNC